jgi:hypothetical protein
MTSPHGGSKIIAEQADLKKFKDVAVIKMDEYELHLIEKFFYSKFDIPGYEFSIKIAGEDAGIFTVLIESDFSKISEVGNVGIEVNRKFYGINLPARTTRAVFPLFKEHGQYRILITTNESNNSIENACEELSAIYLDTIKNQDDNDIKKRYVLELNAV